METRKTLRDPRLLEARDQYLARLKGLFDGEVQKQAFILCGVNGSGTASFYSDPELWMEQALADLAAQTGLLRDSAVFRPLSVNPWPYGVHFIDKLFGARVYELEGEKENWQTEFFEQRVGSLKMPDLEGDQDWQLARRLARAFVRSGVTVPFFAPPVLSSPLNIALNLYGQEFLAAMLAEPGAARHDLRVIAAVIRRLHRWFQANVPLAQLQMVETKGRIQPPGHGQLCGCSTQLLSPDQYRRFIAPLDDGILSLYPGGGMIHLCGTHTQHIPVWRAMKSLRAVQVNDRAAEDLPRYFNELRRDQVIYVSPCAGMPIERIMALTGGQRVVIPGDVKEHLPSSSRRELQGLRMIENSAYDRASCRSPQKDGRDGARPSKDAKSGLFLTLEGRPPCRPQDKNLNRKLVERFRNSVSICAAS